MLTLLIISLLFSFSCSGGSDSLSSLSFTIQNSELEPTDTQLVSYKLVIVPDASNTHKNAKTIQKEGTFTNNTAELKEQIAATGSYKLSLSIYCTSTQLHKTDPKNPQLCYKNDTYVFTTLGADNQPLEKVETTIAGGQTEDLKLHAVPPWGHPSEGGSGESGDDGNSSEDDSLDDDSSSDNIAEEQDIKIKVTIVDSN